MSTNQRLLLDTHIWLWYLYGHPQLPQAEVDAIERHPLVCVSFASIWELTIKASSGKIEFFKSLNELVELSQQKAVSIVYPSVMALERLVQLPFIHRDPFDRMIISQAIDLGAILHTHDALVRKYKTQFFPSVEPTSYP